MENKEDESTDDETTGGPIEPWKLLAGASAGSAGVLFIGYKLEKDIVYDLYWYLFAAVVAALIAHAFGWINLDRLQAAVRPEPEE